MDILKQLIKNCPGSRVLPNEPLAPYTTFKVGGSAEFFIEPQNIRALETALSFLRRENIRTFILGGGSNIVVSDNGITGAVLCVRRLDGVEEISGGLLCGCGASFETVSLFCEKNGLGGLFEFSGLPGTVGGAVYMNARCYEKSISNVLLYADYIDLDTLETKRYVFDETDWEYKKSPFQGQNRLILSAAFKVTEENADYVRERNVFYVTDRKNRRQFDFPSAGSAFKNNRTFGSPSGKIIDEAGLCGVSVGGASVAAWHGNFIINTGNATARDIRELTELVISRVKEKTSYVLEPEILFIE